MVKIMLDAGHGGKDSGACGNGLQEKDLTLDITKRVGNLLSGYENTEVFYTRTDDRFVDLSERAAMANREKVDYFSSFHINCGGGIGFESYVFFGTDARTIALQNVIHTEVMKAIGVTDRGKKQANYAVLRETYMPAILTESLFIDNANDAAKLKSSDFLQQVAQGHVNGLVAALRLKKKQVASPLVQTVQPPQGLGILEITSDTVIRQDAVYTAPIIRSIGTNEGAFLVHNYQNGWYNIGGWVYKECVKFTPNDDVKMAK